MGDREYVCNDNVRNCCMYVCMNKYGNGIIFLYNLLIIKLNWLVIDFKL